MAFDRLKKLEKRVGEARAWRGRRGGRGVVAAGGVVELMRRVRGSLIVGRWHEEYARLLEGSLGSGARVVLAAPVQHGN